jgi:AcrR family transcriptional regulator
MRADTPTKGERGEATRTALITAARNLFREFGYGGVGTEEIVRRAAVTRGALYHHFADKSDLFRAVNEHVETEVVDAIAAEMEGIEDPLDQLIAGARAYLEICTDPAITRITLMDAPSVLSWEEWREAGMSHGQGLIIAVLQSGIDAGELQPQPVNALAHILTGALGEAGMMIANASDPDTTRAEFETAMVALLDGLRAAPSQASTG